MRGCLALEAAPAGATQVVAYVQQELNPHVASCPGMRTLTADGRGGQQTDGTIAAYLACTNLQASWSSPAIGDYVALGLHLAERHGR